MSSKISSLSAIVINLFDYEALTVRKHRKRIAGAGYVGKTG